MRQSIVAGLVVAVVVVNGCGGGAGPTPTPAAEIPVIPLISATGKVVPALWAVLSTPAGATVAEVSVEPGEVVAAGQMLVRFDSTEAELGVQQAEAALQAAQAQLALLRAGARPEDIAAAGSAVTQTLAHAGELQGTLPAATEQARLDWIQAANVLRDTQARYENIYWDNRELEKRLDDGKLPDANRDAEAQAWREIENAEAAMEQARLAYEQAQQRQTSALNGAWAQVEAAQASLARLTHGTRSEELAVAEVAVAEATVAVEMARLALERCEVHAPFGGTVGAVHVRVGEMALPGQPLLTVGDLATLRVETTDLDEIGVARVAVGQKVSLTFDALPEQVLSGHVVRISPMPEAGSGGVHYATVIALDRLDPAIRWGMTAFVDIEVGR